MTDMRTDTSQGALVGRRCGHAVVAYLGVPYAAAPVGDRRFAPPGPPPRWDGVRDATRFGPASLQAPSASPRPLVDLSVGAEDEDCLSLNVWTPGGAGLPVLVFLHGGAFVTGAGSVPAYDGAALAARGAVVVTVNYRLGLLGWLRCEQVGASGNQGLADQVAALGWVEREIASFGGDPANVTLLGESAGAASVAAHLAAGRGGRLFRRAILQSGAHDLCVGVAKADAAAGALADAFAADGRTLADLRTMPAAEVVAWQQRALPRSAGIPFGPVCDGDLVPVDPYAALAAGAASNGAVLAGTNRDEMGFFWGRDPVWDEVSEERLLALAAAWSPAPRATIDVYRAARAARGEPVDARSVAVAMGTDATFRNGVLAVAEAQSREARAHVYRFDWASPLYDGLVGACHVLELPFVFGTHRHPSCAAFVGDLDAADALSDEMQRAWVAFATNGDPGWPAYDEVERPTRIFDRTPRVEHDPQGPERAAWAAAVTIDG